MSQSKQPFLVKLSLPGKLNEELSYVFSDTLVLVDEKTISLFGLFSIHSPKEIYQQFIKEIVQAFLDFYTKSSQNAPQQSQDSNNDYDEFVFESAIRYTHDCFLNFLNELQENKQDSFDAKKINFILGALIDNQIYLSGAGGRMYAFYIHPVFTKQRGFSHYTSTPIVDGKQDSATQNRIFSYLVQGAVGVQGSSIALLNQALLDYIPLDQLKQILTNNPIEKISSYFHSLLGKIHAKNDFAALFINPSYLGPLEFSSTAARQTASSLSMAGLNSTARGTEHVLSPTLKPLFIQILELLWNILLKGIKKLFKGGLIVYKKIPFLYSRGTHALIKGWNIIKKLCRIFAGFITSFLHICIVLTHKGPRMFIHKILNKFKKLSLLSIQRISLFLIHIQSKGADVQKCVLSIYEKKSKTLQNIPGGSKALLLLSILFLILFIFSAITINYKQREKKTQDTYSQGFSELEHSYMSIQSKVPYSSENDLQSQFQELDTRLQNFKKIFLKRDEKFDRLIDRVALLKSQIFHITSLNHLVQLGTVPQELQSDDTSLTSLENTLIISSSMGFAQYQTREKTFVTLRSTTKNQYSCVAAFQKNELFACSQSKDSLDIISTQKSEVTHYALQLNSLQKNITSAQIFNNKLYLLDGESGTIFKYTRSNLSYTQGISLFKKPSEQLKNARDMTIDGAIYILRQDSSLVKISHGTLTLFPLPHIQPVLTSIKKLTSQEKSPYLFLLDSKQNRILVIDKQDGHLKNQIISPLFENLQDIALKKDGKELYVLNNNQLILIEIK